MGNIFGYIDYIERLVDGVCIDKGLMCDKVVKDFVGVCN